MYRHASGDAPAKTLVKNYKFIFEKLLAPGFVYTENENTYSRSEMISSLMSGHNTIEDAYNKEMLVHIYAATAVVTGWMTVKGKS